MRRFIGAVVVAGLTLAAGAAEAQTVNLKAAAQNAEVKVTRDRQTFDVTTEGWACGQPLDDKPVLDAAEMGRLTQAFTLFEVNLRGMAGLKAKFSEDRALAGAVFDEAAERTLGEPFFDADRKAIRLLAKYESDEAITAQNAAEFFNYKLDGKGRSGTVGHSSQHPSLLSVYRGLAPGSKEHELGHCYTGDTLARFLADLRQEAADLREVLNTVRELRGGLIPIGAGS